MNVLTLQKKLFPLLNPLGCLYARLMKTRRQYLESNPDLIPPIPCISVGNIAWGGTGKTPITDFIAGRMNALHIRTAILTRGYGAHPPQLPFEVMPDSSPLQAGDEPLMLKQMHPECAVIEDPKRTRGAEYALKNNSPDLFILDDGFQHVRMGRHLDLVLLRPDDLKDDWNHVIPSGPWREGADALQKADAFLIKADDDAVRRMEPLIQSRLDRFEKPIFAFSLTARFPRRISGVGLPPGNFTLVSGVGDPRQVRTAAARLIKIKPDRHLIFPDHHQYTAADAQNIAKGGLPVVCTEKDAEKLRPFGLNLWSMPVKASFGAYIGSSIPFETWLTDWFFSASEAIRQKKIPPKPCGYDKAAVYFPPKVRS